jgi:hypothetical protein
MSLKYRCVTFDYHVWYGGCVCRFRSFDFNVFFLNLSFSTTTQTLHNIEWELHTFKEVAI